MAIYSNFKFSPNSFCFEPTFHPRIGLFTFKLTYSRFVYALFKICFKLLDRIFAYFHFIPVVVASKILQDHLQYPCFLLNSSNGFEVVRSFQTGR